MMPKKAEDMLRKGMLCLKAGEAKDTEELVMTGSGGSPRWVLSGIMAPTFRATNKWPRLIIPLIIYLSR